MTPSGFKRWREFMKLSQGQAAAVLDLSPNTIANYEKGERKEGEVSVPKTVELACAAVSLGLTHYAGPTMNDHRERRPFLNVERWSAVVTVRTDGAGSEIMARATLHLRNYGNTTGIIRKEHVNLDIGPAGGGAGSFSPSASHVIEPGHTRIIEISSGLESQQMKPSWRLVAGIMVEYEDEYGKSYLDAITWRTEDHETTEGTFKPAFALEDHRHEAFGGLTFDHP